MANGNGQTGGATPQVVRWVSFGAGLILLLFGILIIGGELGFKFAHAFGLHTQEDCVTHVDDLWGIGQALAWGIGCCGVAFAFMLGAPGEFGRKVLDGVAGFFSRFGGGGGG